LAEFLNLRATDAAKGNFSLNGNTLTIGNVGKIWAYTITEAKGIRRVLCLGTKKKDEAEKTNGKNIINNVAPIDNKKETILFL
jgi:hypothetical protein